MKSTKPFAERRQAFKKTLSPDQARKGRAAVTDTIRKEKKNARLAKRRMDRAKALGVVPDPSSMSGSLTMGTTANAGAVANAGAGSGSSHGPDGSPMGSSLVTSSTTPIGFSSGDMMGGRSMDGASPEPSAGSVDVFVGSLPTLAHQLATALAESDEKLTLDTLTKIRKGLIFLDDNVDPILALGPAFMDGIYQATASPTLRISYEALWIINNLCYTKYTKDIMSKPGFLAFLLNDRLVHKHSPTIRGITLWILANVASDKTTCHLLTCDPSCLGGMIESSGSETPSPTHPDRFTSTSLPVSLMAITKDLVSRLDSGAPMDEEDLEILGWLLASLATPARKGKPYTKEQFAWAFSCILPILETLLFKPLRPDLPPNTPISQETHTLRQELSLPTLTLILDAISNMTADNETFVVEVLVKRPPWVAFALSWIQSCFAKGHFEELYPALKITGNIVQSSSEIADLMVRSNIVDIYFMVLDHPHCDARQKREAAFGLSNLAVDLVHHRKLLQSQWIGRAVTLWTSGIAEVRREFGHFFYNLIEMHDEMPGPLFDLLQPTPFYQVLKKPLEAIMDQTIAGLCMKICLKLFEMGRDEELYDAGIDEAIRDEVALFSFESKELQGVSAALEGYVDEGERDGGDGDDEEENPFASLVTPAPPPPTARLPFPVHVSPPSGGPPSFHK